jgi:MFS family permease
MAACALILAVLTLSETVTAMHVLILSAISGIFMAVDAPARLSFVTELVGKEDLGNAIALNASTFNAARLIGPSIAGIIVPFFGEGVCFLLNAASYFALIIGLISMRNLPPSVPSSGEPLFKQLRDAYHYIGDSPVHRLLIRNVIAFAIFGFSYTTLLPIFADHILHSDAGGLGILMGAGGIGALAGGIWQASLSRETKRGPMVMGGSLGLGIGILLFGFSNQFEVSIVALAITGFSGIVMLTSTNTLLQSLTPDHLRGRVLGFYTSSFLGFLPVGSFIAGAAADFIGAPLTMLLTAVICIGVSVYIIVHYRRLRVV